MKNQFFFEAPDGQLDRTEMWISLGIAGAAAIFFMVACLLDFTVGRDQLASTLGGKPPAVAVSGTEIRVAESPRLFTNDTAIVVPRAAPAVVGGSRGSWPRAAGSTHPITSPWWRLPATADF